MKKLNFRLFPLFFAVVMLSIFACEDDRELTDNPLFGQKDTTATDTSGNGGGNNDTTGGGGGVNDTIEFMNADLDSVNTDFPNVSFTDNGATFALSGGDQNTGIIDFSFTNEPDFGERNIDNQMNTVSYSDVSLAVIFNGRNGKIDFTFVDSVKIEGTFEFIAVSNSNDTVIARNGSFRVNK